MFTRFAEWLCFARIPGWTARVGQPWDTYDVTPWNLYNILWRGQQTLARRVLPERRVTGAGREAWPVIPPMNGDFAAAHTVVTVTWPWGWESGWVECPVCCATPTHVQ